MTDKPQTLAEQIRALAIPDDFTDEEATGYWQATHDAAAIADAAATTTPAEQAGDVRQAMPEWDYFQGLVNIARRSATKAKIKYPQPNYVTLKIAEEAGEVVRGAVHYAEGRMEWNEVQGEIIQLLAMLIRFVTEGDEVNGVIPPELVRCVPPPLEPDPTPALGWKAMQTAAISVIYTHGDGVVAEALGQRTCCSGHHCGCRGETVEESLRDAILALPGPSDEQALAEAMKLPEWQAMEAELATLREAMGNNCNALTAADRAYLIAHLSYELEPVGKPPTWNQLAMEVIRLSNAIALKGGA